MKESEEREDGQVYIKVSLNFERKSVCNDRGYHSNAKLRVIN